MADYVAAVDQGTTSTRCMIFNHHGLPVGMHQMEHKQIYPQAGWVEHDPMEIWARTQDVIKGALKAAKLTANDIAAVGVTNQRETTVVWDKKTGKPYYNAIVWQDTRTDKLIKEFEGGSGQNRFRDKVGLPLATYFSGPKVRWILDNVPEAKAAAERGDAVFGNIDTWVIWWLTGGPDGGVHITDVSNASRTMLMNLKTLDWDKEIAGIMGVPLSMLPKVMPSSAVYGHTKADGPFGGRIPVSGDLGDQQAATVGQNCFAPGEAKNTYGTGCFMLLNTGEEIVHSRNGLLTTVCYQLGDARPVYALEGSIAMAGATIQWLRDNLGLIQNAAESETIAQGVDDAGGCYLVPAFSGLYAPYWRSDARGVLVGLTRYINRAHIVRAALESICYQTREVLEAMNADSGVPLKVLKVDGGATANNFLMQLQADILGAEVVRPRVAETTSLGAAYAAGLAVGYWENLDALRENWQVGRRWQPQIDETRRESGFAGWKKAVARTLDWVEP